MNYLITGGTGFIGSEILDKLVQKTDQAIVFSRKKKKPTGNIRFITCFTLIGSHEKIDCIINLAGKPIDCLWTKRNKQALIDSRISMTKSLVDLVARLNTKPKLLISASAIGFYGIHEHDKIIDESYRCGPENPNSFTHELCSKWEKEALKMKKFGLRVCITRFGVVIGKNGGFMKKTSLPFRLGLGGRFGDGKQFFPWIHMKDVLSIIESMIHKPEYSGIYNLVAPEFITNEEITKHIADSFGRPRLLHMPSFLVKTIFGEMGKNLLLNGNKIYPKRLIEQGYEFKVPKICMHKT